VSEREDLEGIQLADLLTYPMQRKFAIEYAENGGHGTPAAKVAGYAHPSQEQVRLLKLPNVKAAIKRHLAVMLRNANESRETIIGREANWANSDIRDYFDYTNDTNGVLKDFSKLTKEQGQCIKKISWNRNGPVLELHDPGRANRHLAEYAGMLKQKVSDMTPIEAAEAISDALKAMNEADGTDPS
jgi:hypothetical protein